MDRRKEWQRSSTPVTRVVGNVVLGFDFQAARSRTYEVELDSKNYEVEVELLENREDCVQIIVAVDDGILQESLFR